MIIDRLDRAHLYTSLGERLDRALAFLQQTDLSSLAPGKHVIDGDNLYAMALQYTTKTAEEWSQFEAHRNYIDVQYVLEGSEQMGYADLDALTVTQEYNPDKDALLLKGDGDFLHAPAGTFLVFWPTDAHLPGRALTGPAPVKKIVVKVKV